MRIDFGEMSPGIICVRYINITSASKKKEYIMIHFVGIVYSFDIIEKCKHCVTRTLSTVVSRILYEHHIL